MGLEFPSYTFASASATVFSQVTGGFESLRAIHKNMHGHTKRRSTTHQLCPRDTQPQTSHSSSQGSKTRSGPSSLLLSLKGTKPPSTPCFLSRLPLMLQGRLFRKLRRITQSRITGIHRFSRAFTGGPGPRSRQRTGYPSVWNLLHHSLLWIPRSTLRRGTSEPSAYGRSIYIMGRPSPLCNMS